MKEHQAQWTLGQLIDALEGQKQTNPVRFDFCMVEPTKLNSYRGYYEDLALGWKPQTNYPKPTVADLLATLKKQLGTTVHGYKGGEYVVSRSQILYVANYGDTGSTAVVGVDSCGDSGWQTIIKTLYTEIE